MTDDAEPRVVDASAILPVVDHERCSPRAARWFAASRARAAESITVDLFDVECANALWKRVRRERWEREDALRALDQILQLPYQRMPLRAVASEALDIGLTLELTVYDACYVALARMTGMSLVTADRRMARAARAVGCDALCLTEDLGAS